MWPVAWTARGDGASLFKVGGQRLQLLPRRRCNLTLVVHMLLDLTFDHLHALQRLVPPTLQLVGDQTVFRIRAIVLLLRAPRAVARRFQVPMKSRQDVVLFAGFLFACHDRRL
jgi:hypothetical protein